MYDLFMMKDLQASKNGMRESTDTGLAEALMLDFCNGFIEVNSVTIK